MLTIVGIVVATSAIGATPESHWIGPPRHPVSDRHVADRHVADRDVDGQAEQAVPTLRTSFEIERPLRTAKLRIGADFCVATLSINNDTVTRVTPYDLPLPIEVTRWCEAGANSVTVRVERPYGPAAVAIELVLTFEEGDPLVVVSSDDWKLQATPGDSFTSKVETFGRVDYEPWWRIRDRPSTNAFDEYNQWRDARTEQGSVAAKLSVPNGFEMKAVYQVPEKYGSWISLTRDQRGWLYAGSEKHGVFRIKPGQRSKAIEANRPPVVDCIHRDLLGCHGIVWSEGNLFVNASDSRALYRLRDTNGDGNFDAVTQLRDVPGGKGDHGRNDLVIDRDGSLLSIHGDAVDLPDGFSSRVPITHEFENGAPRGGHLIRTDRDGSTWQVFASGLRNPYGVALNREGEAFTYDADSERHWGLPWYRPTRMNHLVPGTDYGWRSREGLPWPTYHADSMPPNVLIGRGSPTSVKFGYESRFPIAYRDAMFAPDWSFGRVFAVHVIPRGASYSMHPATFLRGRPLNVCDLEFADDGSMYLLTGGHGTRSVLYRVRAISRNVESPSEPDAVDATQQVQDRVARSEWLRNLRRRLEEFHRPVPGAVHICWPHLDHADRWIAHAARVVLEHQPPTEWRDRLMAETDVRRKLPAMLAWVRVGKPDAAMVWSTLAELQFASLSQRHLQQVVRIVQWLDEYHSMPGDSSSSKPSSKVASNAALKAALMRQLESIYPAGVPAFDREVCDLLSRHGSTVVVRKTLDALSAELSQNDRLHMLNVLSTTKQGWTVDDRVEFFRLLQAARLSSGDESMPGFLKRLEENAIARLPTTLPQETSERLLQLLEFDQRDDPQDRVPTPTRPFVKKWTVRQLLDSVPADRVANVDKGRELFRQAQCANCHRVGRIGRSMGPDLTGVTDRFNRHEIVTSIVQPSKYVSSRFVNHVIVMSDGRVHTGQIVWNGFRKSIIRIAPDPQRLDRTIELSKHEIESQQASAVSPMPEGLLDTLTAEEIEDLLAFLATRGQLEAD